jgi:hypothetical protein
LNETARRLFGFEAKEEFFQLSSRAFDFDEHTLRRIVDPAAQAQFRCEPKYERTKPNALHRAVYDELQPRAMISRS